MYYIYIATVLTSCFVLYTNSMNVDPTSNNYKNYYEEKVITQPYTPSFITRYSYTIDSRKFLIATTAVTHLLAPLITNYSLDESDSKKLFITVSTILAAGTLAYTYARYCQPTLLDTLLLNPLQIIKEINKVTYEFKNHLKDTKINTYQTNKKKEIMRYKRAVGMYQQLLPFFLLDECTSVHDCQSQARYSCLLSRYHNKNYRQIYEDTLVTMMIQKIQQNPTHSFSYFSFGSGAMLQDLVVLTKLLAQKPNSKLTIHLLDKYYTLYIFARDILQDGHEITGDQNSNISSVMPQLLERIRDFKNIDTQKSKISISCTKVECISKQFIAWLRSTFPCAQLSLHLHSNAQQFAQNMHDGIYAYPDVLSTVDIEDEMSILYEAPIEYAKLCYKTLKNNPTAHNIWLSKRSKKFKQDGKAHILSIRLQSIPDAQKNVLVNNKKKDNIIYLSDKAL